MRAGLLTEIITIKRAVITKNQYGEDVERWDTVATTRARVMQTTSNRTIENDEVVYDFQKEFVVRYYVDVQTYDKIIWQNKEYRILNYDKSHDLQQITIIGELING